MERKKNWAVYILFFLAVIAGVLAFIDAGRYMGWIPINATVPGLGEINFVLPSAQWFAAIMSAILGAIWFLVAYWLWTLNPSGWMFMVVIAVINLIFLGLAILGRTTFMQVLPAVLVNVLVLILGLLPGTKAAFMPPMPSKADVQAARASAAATVAKAAPPPAAAPKAEAAAPKAEAAAPEVTKAEVEEAVAKVKDLMLIEGIGPKISQALQDAGVNTYADLAAMSPEQIQEILREASLSADPSTWPKQAQMVADGQMDELKAYQEELQGGREA